MADYDDLPDMLTAAEVTAFLRLARGTTYKMIQRGILPSVRFGKCLRVPKAALLPLIQKPAPLKQRRSTNRQLNDWVEHVAAIADKE
jgi:excisionase family DNA binding protein